MTENIQMPETVTLIVSESGQITLPASIRKKYGIHGGGALILEEGDNELRLKPAAIMEMDLYRDSRIAKWDQVDKLTNRERERIVRKLAK